MSNSIDPYRPPFVVNVDVARELQEFVPLFTGACMLTLSDIPNDNRGPGRALYLQIMEKEERLFAEMVNALATATQFVLEAEDLPLQRTESVIKDLLPVIVDGYYGLCIDRFAEDFERSGAITEQQYHDRVKVISRLEDLRRDMERFYNQGRGMSRGSSTTSSWGGGGRNTGGRSSWTSGNERPSARMQETRKAADGVFVSSRDVGTNSAARESFVGSAGRVSRALPPAPVEEKREKPNVYDGRQFYPMRKDQTTQFPLTLNPRRPWDWVIANPNLQLRPAHLSDWKLTPDPAKPAVPWYDPNTAILFHFKDSSGKVWAQPFAIEDDMEYAKHELDAELRSRAAEEKERLGPKVVATFELVNNIRPTPGKPLAELGPVEGVADEVRRETPDSFEVTDNIKAVYDRNLLKLKVSDSDALKKPYEFYADISVLTTVVNPSWPLLREISTANDFQRLLAVFGNAGEGDEELVASANVRITAAINRVLQVNLGLQEWSMDDFIEDFDDLLKLLREQLGDVTANALTDSASEVIGANLAYFTQREGAEGLYESLGLPTVGSEGVLIWRERSSITRIPLTSVELALPAGARMLDQANVPDFYAAVDSILNRTQDMPVAYTHRYVALADGKVYELSVGYYDRTALILQRTDIIVAQ